MPRIAVAVVVVGVLAAAGLLFGPDLWLDDSAPMVTWQQEDEIPVATADPVDAAGTGGRGRVVGDAQCSPLHCNFMVNRGQASAADIETLVEGLRKDVLNATGVELRWEIRRIGDFA